LISRDEGGFGVICVRLCPHERGYRNNDHLIKSIYEWNQAKLTNTGS